MYLFLFLNQARGVPCKTQQEKTNATYCAETVELLFRVLHCMPVAPVGTDNTQFTIGLDEKLLEQDQERICIEVAAR